MNSPYQPRLTVLMPVLNAMPYLPAAVASLQAQIFRDFVVLAIDDGSTDKSVAYLRSIEDPRFDVIADGRSRGMGATLNLGLRQVKTDLVARMDADDVCPPERFAWQVERLDRDPMVGALGTQFTYFGSGGRTGFARWLPLSHEDIDADLMRGTLCVIHASLMIRTAPFRDVGGYRISGTGEDWDLFLRLAEVTRFANLPQVGYHYRLHDRNASSAHQHLCQTRIGYACACAAARRAGKPEPDEAAYLQDLAASGRWSAVERRLDSASLAQYFTARSKILNNQSVSGYLHLALSVALGPRRVASRVAAHLRHAASNRHAPHPRGNEGGMP